MASAVAMMMMMMTMDGTTQVKTKVAKGATPHFGTRRAKHVTRRRPSSTPSATPLRLGPWVSYKNPLSMWYLIQIIQCITDGRLNL